MPGRYEYFLSYNFLLIFRGGFGIIVKYIIQGKTMNNRIYIGRRFGYSNIGWEGNR